MKQILDVGNCGPDHGAIKRLFSRHFHCEVTRADQASDALEKLEQQAFDLVLVNRKLDIDYSDGLQVIRQLKASPTGADTPIMMITNYPEHQESAVAAGAIWGFGKLELDSNETVERIRAVLE